jgi:hypothetical protein
MSRERELLKRLLEICNAEDWDTDSNFDELLADIRAFVASETEADVPVAWLIPGAVTVDASLAKANGSMSAPLYTRPLPARKPMTSEEMVKQYEIDKEYFGESVMRAFYNGIRFAEKHHGIERDDDQTT